MTLERSKVIRKNKTLVDWVDRVARRTEPDKIVWCDGSDEEYCALIKLMLVQKTLIELDQSKFPNCYLYRSDPHDVARTEASTFICTAYKDEAGPTNNWKGVAEAEKTLWQLFDGSMKGRTMYVVPFSMGPLHSSF